MKRAATLIGLTMLVGVCYAEHAYVGGNRTGIREVVIDLPKDLHVRNTAGIDQAGLCVWASMQMHANWLGCRPLMDAMIRMQKEKGGGWPERVTEKMKQWAPDVPYVQYEGKDPAILDIAMKTYRGACVTYGHGERYVSPKNTSGTIAHMVFLSHLDPPGTNKPMAAIIDNNFPGTWEWMSRDEFLERWKHPGGSGWAFVILTPPPPPPPSN